MSAQLGIADAQKKSQNQNQQIPFFWVKFSSNFACLSRYYPGPEQQVLLSLKAVALDTHPNFRSRTKERSLVVFDRFHDEFYEDS